jgi:hypothetical protein
MRDFPHYLQPGLKDCGPTCLKIIAKFYKKSAWCKRERITHTPTIFINGYELPDEYNVHDLIDVI